MSPLLALNPDRGRRFFQVTYWQTMTSANEITDDVDIIIALSTVADSGFYVDIALYLFVFVCKDRLRLAPDAWIFLCRELIFHSYKLFVSDSFLAALQRQTRISALNKVSYGLIS